MGAQFAADAAMFSFDEPGFMSGRAGFAYDDDLDRHS
jgi:hypothetical protein